MTIFCGRWWLVKVKTSRELQGKSGRILLPSTEMKWTSKLTSCCRNSNSILGKAREKGRVAWKGKARRWNQAEWGLPQSLPAKFGILIFRSGGSYGDLVDSAANGEEPQATEPAQPPLGDIRDSVKSSVQIQRCYLRLQPQPSRKVQWPSTTGYSNFQSMANVSFLRNGHEPASLENDISQTGISWSVSTSLGEAAGFRISVAWLPWASL